MRKAALLVVVVGSALPGSLRAQRGWDAQIHGIALLRDSALVGGGMGAGIRFRGGLRAAATASGGWLGGHRVAGRVELLAAYHLPPTRPTHPSVYLGGGIALEARQHDVRGLVLLALGVEARPWMGGGWFAELGVGGGLRVAVGYRQIRLKSRR